jgi:predicted molibdopterin-dependent oxidoreductase YjgC
VPLNDENRETFSSAWGAPVPSAPGLSTVPMVQAMERGEIDFLYNLGGNLLAVLPDPKRVVTAFQKTRFRIHQDIVFNTSTVLEPGEAILVLPAQTRYEQRGSGTSTNTERRVRFSPEIPGHPQVGECRPEYEIPCQVVSAAFPARKEQLSYPDAQAIRDEMGRLMPLYAGIEKMSKAGDWIQWGGPRLFADGKFATDSGRARFTPVQAVEIPVPEGAFYLTTRRGKQFNSIVLKTEDRVQGGKARDDLLISAEDLRELRMRDGDRARVRSEIGEFLVTLRENPVRPGMVQAYWPECNVVIGQRLDPRSEEPDYNAVVWIERL